MSYTLHIDTILWMVPKNKVISYKTLADIFFVSPITIKWLIEHSNHEAIYRVIPHNWWVQLHNTKKLIASGIVVKNNKVAKEYFRKPIITNYYISLITKDITCIGMFWALSKKIALLHPNTIYKTPNHYHITLADCSNTKLSHNKIDNIFSETDWLIPFHFHCILHKPYIDTKKQKVVFWIRLQNNPFLLTLHKCIQKYVPRKSDKKYLPHITLGKIIKSTVFSQKFDTLSLDTMCTFDTICITANIDNTKEIILFSKILV